MPNITLTISDEDVDRIASQIAIKLADAFRAILPQKPNQPQLERPVPNDRLEVTRVEAARLLGFKNAITVDRLRARGLLHPSCLVLSISCGSHSPTSAPHPNPDCRGSLDGYGFQTMINPMKRADKTASFAQIRAVKAEDRHRDSLRLARREVTPAQLQAENAAVRNSRDFEILNVSASARSFRHQLQRGH